MPMPSQEEPTNLNQINDLESLSAFIDRLQVTRGALGGRKYEISGVRGKISLNDITRKFKELSTKSDSYTLNTRLEIAQKIINLDRIEPTLPVRRISRVIGNLFYNRLKTLAECTSTEVISGQNIHLINPEAAAYSETLKIVDQHIGKYIKKFGDKAAKALVETILDPQSTTFEDAISHFLTPIDPSGKEKIERERALLQMASALASSKEARMKEKGYKIIITAMLRDPHQLTINPVEENIISTELLKEAKEWSNLGDIAKVEPNYYELIGKATKYLGIFGDDSKSLINTIVHGKALDPNALLQSYNFSAEIENFLTINGKNHPQRAERERALFRLAQELWNKESVIGKSKARQILIDTRECTPSALIDPLKENIITGEFWKNADDFLKTPDGKLSDLMKKLIKGKRPLSPMLTALIPPIWNLDEETALKLLVTLPVVYNELSSGGGKNFSLIPIIRPFLVKNSEQPPTEWKLRDDSEERARSLVNLAITCSNSTDKIAQTIGYKMLEEITSIMRQS